MTSLAPSLMSLTSSSEIQDNSGAPSFANQIPITGNLTEAPAEAICVPSLRVDIESPHLRMTSTYTFSQISTLRVQLRRLDDLVDGLRELHQLFQGATDEEIRKNGAEVWKIHLNDWLTIFLTLSCHWCFFRLFLSLRFVIFRHLIFQEEG